MSEFPSELWGWFSAAAGPHMAPIGVMTPVGSMPLIHTKREVMEELRPIAQAHAEASGMPVYLLRFGAVTVADTLQAPKADA